MLYPMKKVLFVFFACALLFLRIPRALAVESPLSQQNNKVGIHILFPSELTDAAKLVNSNGGDFGYVIIPIQSGDKNIEKWQAFMDQARKLHVIPILRLATQGDYFNTAVWSKPTLSDVLDFANFLNSLNWPTKNRYVVVYNEPNRNDEWGGNANASEYAQILSYAVTSFKSRNADFFIISAGMDNGAANSTTAINGFTYLTQMEAAVPGIFNQIDGLGSHSYPNPAFSQSPNNTNPMGISTYKFEDDYIQSLIGKRLPAFITETGWSREKLSETTIASYYQTAFSTIWNDPDVIAVTPFLLQGGTGPFQTFSFLSGDGKPTGEYIAVQNIPKIKGQPTLTQQVLAAETTVNDAKLPTKSFISPFPNPIKPLYTALVKNFTHWVFHF